MNRDRDSRRSFLRAGLAASCAAVVAGCGGEASQGVEVTKQEDPAVKAKDSMDFYKKSQQKGANSKK